MTLAGNRGEWSELYSLLKILSQGNLQVADSNLNPIRNRMFVVQAITTKQHEGTTTVWIDEESIVVEDGESVPTVEVTNAANQILEAISSAENGKSIYIPHCQDVLKKLGINRVAAGSKSKADLTLRVLDPFLRTSQLMSFSIKSQLGSPATLFNASKATNFEYAIEVDERALVLLRLHDGHPSEILSSARNEGVLIRPLGPVDPRFRMNLLLIDSRMPELLGSLVMLHYETGLSRLVDLAEALTTSDPFALGPDLGKNFYRHKIKMFLADCALGMTPTSNWDGTHSSNGGYVIVTDKGELLCLHSFDRDVFNEYLLHSTKLERGSKSRHEYGSLIEDDQGVHIRLNLQIRFIK